MRDCDLLKLSTTRRWTSICLGSPPVPRPTYHLTTVRPPAAAGSNVSTATGVGVADGVVCAAGADHALETVRARTRSVAPHVSTARLSIGNLPRIRELELVNCLERVNGYGSSTGDGVSG